jgi:NAD(P)-dependent dehydrogenase (short-subunit alcohol dehydrogenase family)
MNVNVTSMFLTSKHAIPAMIKTAGGGAIVNVSSISALRPRGLTTYTVSKGAVIALTQAMAVDHGKDNIRVNCVAPGWIKTAWGEGASDVWQKRAVRESMLGRWGTPEDIAAAVHWLVSPDAAFVTGQVVNVNGGFRRA